MNKTWPYTVPGIPDELFVRGQVPMTKKEVRALTISEACLAPNLTIWDIGAGTGSISIEAALQVKDGQVYAVEKNAEGLSLTEKNAQHFGLVNISIVYGSAPDVLAGLPDPHRIIIGGSGGRLEEIIKVCSKRLLPGGRIVINVISPYNMVQALNLLKQKPYTEANGVYVQTSRLQKLGSEDYFQAQNGVWIISAAKEA